MKKILYMFIFLLGISINVSAKEIVINGISYDDSSDINGRGFSYNTDGKLLILDNYDGSQIAYDGVLEIRLKNDNIINGNGLLVGIDGSEISISGDGRLKIERASIGIETDRIQIQDGELYIKNCNVGLMALGSEIYVYQSNVIIENCNLGIYSAKDICFNYSNVNILECSYGIRRSDNATISLNNAKLYIKTYDYCFDLIELRSISNSQLVLKSDNLATSTKKINIPDDFVIYVCNDLVNYFQEDEYQFYPIIKVAKREEIDLLIEEDKNLIIEFEKEFDIPDDDSENNDLDEEVKDDNLVEQPSNNLPLTSSEYTENEYTFSEYEKVEIVNPSTLDTFSFYIVLFVVNILIVLAIAYLWRHNG